MGYEDPYSGYGGTGYSSVAREVVTGAYQVGGMFGLGLLLLAIVFLGLAWILKDPISGLIKQKTDESKARMATAEEEAETSKVHRELALQIIARVDDEKKELEMVRAIHRSQMRPDEKRKYLGLWLDLMVEVCDSLGASTDVSRRLINEMRELIHDTKSYHEVESTN